MCLKPYRHIHLSYKVFCIHGLFLWAFKAFDGFCPIAASWNRFAHIISFIICSSNNNSKEHRAFGGGTALTNLEDTTHMSEHPSVELLLDCCPRIRPRRKPARVLESCGTPKPGKVLWLDVLFHGWPSVWMDYVQEAIQMIRCLQELSNPQPIIDSTSTGGCANIVCSNGGSRSLIGCWDLLATACYQWPTRSHNIQHDLK